MWTVLDHSSSAPVRVRGSSPQKPYVMSFNYSASPEQLRAIVTGSEQCQQEVVYRCRKSRLFNAWGQSRQFSIPNCFPLKLCLSVCVCVCVSVGVWVGI